MHTDPEGFKEQVHASLRRHVDAVNRMDERGMLNFSMTCRADYRIVPWLRENRPQTKIVAVDTVGSITFGGAPRRRHIPGLGTSRRPEIFDPSGIHAVEMVPEAAAVAMCRYLARNHAILGGGSTGTVMAAVHTWRDRLPPEAVVVAVSPDFGERYLDTIYDDLWVTDRYGGGPLAVRPRGPCRPSGT